MIGTYEYCGIEAKLVADGRLTRPEVEGLLDIIDEVLTAAARRATGSFEAEWPGLFADEVVDMLVALLVPIADRPHLTDEMYAAAAIFQALYVTFAPPRLTPRPRVAVVGCLGLAPAERQPVNLQRIALGLLGWIGVDILVVTAYACIRARERS
ncbi:hypothetical protein ACFXPW_11805 [Streptomyces goshikiensis]|uniref:hypothetical protein n=1 Tax=Streptomyces goshikiensis TaxID=1942 RepID=UPI0036C29792